MERKTDEPPNGSRVERQWGRTAQTRASLLDAAREVFLEYGFAQASIAHVVERSGSSVGSIYHHFGGKSELYLALWETHQRAYTDAASQAVASLRRGGEEDPVELFVGGARAYLDTTWANHEVARLFLTGDGPPGFDTMQRRQGRDWIRQNGSLLRAKDDSFGRVQVMVLTSIIGDAAREICSLDSRKLARETTEVALSFVRKVAS